MNQRAVVCLVAVYIEFGVCLSPSFLLTRVRAIKILFIPPVAESLSKIFLFLKNKIHVDDVNNGPSNLNSINT